MSYIGCLSCYYSCPRRAVNSWRRGFSYAGKDITVQEVLIDRVGVKVIDVEWPLATGES